MGRSSVTIHLLSSLLGANNVRETVTEAYATFVHVEGQRATPHGLVVSPPTDPDRLTRWKHIVAQRSAAQA